VDYIHLLLAEPQAQPRADRIALAFERVQRVKTRTLIERMSGPSAFAQSDSAVRVRPIGLRAVQDSVLRDGELLIEWLVAEDRSYRFAVSRESVQVDSGPGLRVLQSEVQDVRGRLAARPVQADAAGSVETRALSRTMWAGLEGPIARAKRLIVAPDGPVHLVPFAALDLPSPGSPHALASFVQVPSATVLADIRRRAPPHSEAHGLFACAATGSSLEGARHEVLWLSRRYRDVVTGASDTLELADLVGYRALHLAGHSLVDDRFPWRSAIGARRREAPGSPGDSTALPTLSDRAGNAGGALRAETIASGHLDARLVVLSSCATAGGRVINGEGVAGLSTAFLGAGAPTVLATLWPVDDRATDHFMREFYQGLGQGMTAGEALTRAQERFRRDPREHHPFYWAGFVILGESETRLPLQRRPAVPAGVWAGLAGGTRAAPARRLIGVRTLP